MIKLKEHVNLYIGGIEMNQEKKYTILAVPCDVYLCIPADHAHPAEYEAVLP